MFTEYRQKMLHYWPQLLLAEIRKVYWPLRGRASARLTTRQCIVCKCANPTYDQPIMAALHRQRVQCSRPFTITDVDFANPLIIRSGICGKQGEKTWISLFV